MREFRLTPEASVDPIEGLSHLGDAAVQQCGRNLAPSRFVQLLIEDSPDSLGLGLNLIPAAPVGVEHARQDGAKAGPPELSVGGEIGAAEEHLAPRREKGGQRPAALLSQHLHRALISRVHVGTLVAVYLDADEILVEEGRQLRALVGLTIHDVAPMAPHGANVEQHRPVAGFSGGKSLWPPGIPMDRLMGGGLQVG